MSRDTICDFQQPQSLIESIFVGCGPCTRVWRATSARPFPTCCGTPLT